MTRTAKITTALTVGLASIALLAGCSSATPTGESAKNLDDSATSAAATKEESSAPAQPDTVKLGQTAKFPDGIEVGVSAPTEFTPSETASGGTLAHNIVWTVTVTNNSDKPFDPSLIYVTVSSGGQEGQGVFDTEAGLNGAATTTILPGKSTSWKDGWNVADPSDLTVEVNPNSMEYDGVVFTN